MDNLVPRSPSSCAGLRKWTVTQCVLRRGHRRSLIRDVPWSGRKIDETYFSSAFRLVINKPNHCSLSLILSFAVTVTIWPREVVSCRNFILRSVTTFWVMSLVGIYPGRACENGVFFRVIYRNLALLLLRVLLLAFIVLLQNKHTSLAENGENLISAQPRISAHLQ